MPFDHPPRSFFSPFFSPSILLGSTSHYLVQKCSVPVMVARRRLKRPPRKSAHLTQHRARVSLAEAAGKDTMARKVDQDVADLRDQMARDEREADPHAPPPTAHEESDELDEDVLIVPGKVASSPKVSSGR